jgi:ATP-dependent helicase HepA
MEAVKVIDTLGFGCLVEHPDVPGVGRVGAVDGRRVRVDCFESAATPVAWSCWVPADECRPVRLLNQTRVYWQDPDTGKWSTGRVVGGSPAGYFVRTPNSEFDVRIPEEQLRVRWDRPIADPVEVLAAGAQESAFFRDARLPMLRSLIMQRAACAGAPGLLSSAIEIYPHQVHTALTVLRDPVQRYLLADEVGLGKTIEAGLIIRQTLLDQPNGRVIVIAPDVLRRQWQAELREKFFIEDFPRATIRISAQETPQRWAGYSGSDLVVVDEAHRLVRVDDPDQSPYRELAALAHSAPRLLLLSATPVTTHLTTYLGLLHLLDPGLYRWEDRQAFQRRFDVRRQLATAVFALDAEFESLLPTAISDIAALLPEDAQFRLLAAQATALLSPEGELLDPSGRPMLAARVEALRAHIAETYRLHRRMIRHRRSQVLRESDDPELLPFEVTGRTLPHHVVLDSAGYEAAQDALMAWRSAVANWTFGHGGNDAASAYGRVLAVLVSRADGFSTDLADALRWRLSADESAARRSGLTGEERELLAAPDVVAAERKILPLLEEAIDGSELAACAEALIPVIRKHHKVVIFCGAGACAGLFHDHLRSAIGERVVAEHTRRKDSESCEAAACHWRDHGGVLTCDDSAEDGLNLQAADAVVHIRLPWSPNRLEQRLGRVDRYDGTSTGHPAACQYVVTSPEGEYSLTGAWLSLLTEGFGIFTGSVSALQDAIDQELPTIWADAVIDGPEGITRQATTVRDDMGKERREIDSMDMLESIHDTESGMGNVAAAIGHLETNWREIENSVLGYAGDEKGGLRFLHDRKGPRQQIVSFRRGPADPLMSPRLFMRSSFSLSPQTMEGGFNRTAVLRLPGTRLLRSGNPFIDMLASVAAIDERGQASVFLRRDSRVQGEPEVYFGMDYLVEADIQAALRLTDDTPETRRALRRQADQLLEPFMGRVWVPAGAAAAVADPHLVIWLDRPYDPGRGDLNLNPDRIGSLLEWFTGRDRFAQAARMADEVGRRELARVSELDARRARAQERGRRTLMSQRARAQARRTAGSLLTDTDSYLLDVNLAEALIAGLSDPRHRLMAVTCLVRTGLAVHRGG